MALRDLNDAWGWIQRIVRRLERVESGAILERSSVTDGVMTFIRGRLRLLAGAVLEIVGSVIGSGHFDWTGRVDLRGPVAITGEDGTLTVDAETVLRSLTRILADLRVENNGRIVVGNVIITPGSGGKITVGIGSAQVVIDGATGRVKAGNLTIDPTVGGGAVAFENGAQLYSHETGNQIEMFTGSAHITARENEVSVGVDATKWVAIRSEQHASPGIHIGGVREGSGGRYLGIDGTELVRLSAGGGGDPGNPPAGNPDGYIWPADPAVYGVSDNFAAHLARGSAEPGVDVKTPVGAPLWAPGAGTILAVQNAPGDATGRYVTLITDEGDWFRFLHNSAIVVTAGQHVEQAQLLAYTGGSGFGKEAYYGPHSHISFKRGYTGAFPGAAALDDFQAYMA